MSNTNYADCACCPRLCRADREGGKKGFCGEDMRLRVAAAAIHRGEEPPISGKGGSGAIFLTGCNLRCVFCQNYQISHQGMGSFVAKNEFANICLALQERGAENINIVTGSHAVPAIVQALECAKMSGLSIPVLWNSSAYETIETLTLLRDAIDIYLPDLKTLDGRLAKQFFGAEDYPRYAVAAIKTMLEFKPHQVIIRHLVLPGHLESTYDVLRWFADNARGRADLSLMTQYTPRPPYPPSAPQRYVNNCEYDTIMSWLAEFEIDDGYYQELETGSEWLPDFTQENPFPSELSIPVWHWREGYSAAPRLD